MRVDGAVGIRAGQQFLKVLKWREGGMIEGIGNIQDIEYQKYKAIDIFYSSLYLGNI